MAKDMLTFDAGDLTDSQLMTVMAVANATKARMDAVEKGCKAVLLDRMEVGTQQAVLDGVQVAKVQRTAGGDDGTWRVKDKEAYGAWLARQDGMEDFVERVPVPTGDAMDPGFLKPLVEKIGGGEIPDGVEWKAPAAPQVRITLDRDKALGLLAQAPKSVERLLAAPDAETEADATPDTEADAEADDPFDILGL